MRFDGRVALITAAASGIGRATAEIISAEGGTVLAVDTDEGRLKDMVSAIQSAGGRAHAYRADALDAVQADTVVERAVTEHGHIDILVNAVGGSTIISRPAATVDELTLPEWQQLITFNLDGTFLFSHALVPVMKRQRGGKIVNISSIAGRGISASSSSAYAAAKGGIIAFTKKLAQELGPVRHHGERHRAQHDVDRAHPAALGTTNGGGAGEGGAPHSASSYGGSPRPGEGDLLPRLGRRGFRHRRHHRRDRGHLSRPLIRGEAGSTPTAGPASIGSAPLRRAAVARQRDSPRDKVHGTARGVRLPSIERRSPPWPTQLSRSRP
jgi:NADP-dependent 3-hydroxy acid dehydrogenase YdfG